MAKVSEMTTYYNSFWHMVLKHDEEHFNIVTKTSLIVLEDFFF